MNIIEKKEDLLNLKCNKFKGELPIMENSKIVFNGSNNILFCDKSVILNNSIIEFNGDNSIIFLASNIHKYCLSLSINHNSTLYIDKNNYFNGNIHIILSEESNLIIGKNSLFSFGIWLRTADPHLIYDNKTKFRINKSKSIYIGDHVWIGQNALLLKGTNIDSGSIVGAASVISGKKIKNNSIYGGNPAKLLKKNIFWDESCVHKWKKSDTKNSLEYNKFISNKPNLTKDQFIYKYNKEESINYDEIEKNLKIKNVNERYKYISNLYKNENKNRFVHNIKKKKKSQLNKYIHIFFRNKPPKKLEFTYFKN